MFSPLLSKRVTLLAAIGFGLATPSLMSDPVGIYAVVDRVVLAPDTANPQTAQIFGTFAFAARGDPNGYHPAQRGYVYYSINPKNERGTRAAWADLKSVAGKGDPVAFGFRYDSLGHVRQASETPANPELYPVGMGVRKLSRGGMDPKVEADLYKARAPGK
jgi:hypothetical protein